LNRLLLSLIFAASTACASEQAAVPKLDPVPAETAAETPEIPDPAVRRSGDVVSPERRRLDRERRKTEAKMENEKRKLDEMRDRLLDDMRQMETVR
jgi:Skp family chaperone for outer membrane proteins